MSKYIPMTIETYSNSYCSKHCNYFSKEDGETQAECSFFNEELLFEKFEGEYLAMRCDKCVENARGCEDN